MPHILKIMCSNIGCLLLMFHVPKGEKKKSVVLTMRSGERQTQYMSLFMADDMHMSMPSE